MDKHIFSKKDKQMFCTLLFLVCGYIMFVVDIENCIISCSDPIIEQR